MTVTESIFEQRCVIQEQTILALRHDLHWARIAFTVARAMLPPERRDDCVAEIKRQASVFKVDNGFR